MGERESHIVLKGPKDGNYDDSDVLGLLPCLFNFQLRLVVNLFLSLPFWVKTGDVSGIL